MTQDKLTQRLASVGERLNAYRKGDHRFYPYEDVTFLLTLVEEYQKALEWYDNVHRNHWAIDLHDLEKVAFNALARGEELAGGE